MLSAVLIFFSRFHWCCSCSCECSILKNKKAHWYRYYQRENSSKKQVVDILKEYANGADIEDTQQNIQAAIKHTKNNPALIHLSRFHHFLQVSASHRVLKEQNAERLMLNYYEYLLRIKNFLLKKYSMNILENLNLFPLETNDELKKYYTQIALKVDSYHAPIHREFRYDRFYVQKVKPFFINDKIYYEVAFVPANDNASKTDSIIAFTDMEITSYYAVKFAIVNTTIEIFDEKMPIRIIVDWEVNIRPCELTNFNKLLDKSSRNYGQAEQRNLNQFLTETGFSLSEIIMFSEKNFSNLKSPENTLLTDQPLSFSIG